MRPAASSAALARRFVARTLRAWGCGPEVGELATLLVSELATNAILHACSDLVVVVDGDADALRVEVQDGSPAQPVVGEIDLNAQSGRGLYLVEHLAQAWGVDHRDGGKAVWFELPEQVAAHR